MLHEGCGGDVAHESSGEEAACPPGTTGEHARRRPPLRTQEEHRTYQSTQ